ncbi:hypothetical protein ER308_16105 [Egibacter rhizosphaerae]|uniref:Uncharacterized protein n=1 Tax=Egibacter rhizosphaerae TaxID=1670831 RepID=A0A411YIN5_9ACTN|nr:hypothetical protein [Egibacter rhizosphaerae]QBI20946.1 hypothetical protein ER308_16105 [Egibacter rhizosphaerae]
MNEDVVRRFVWVEEAEPEFGGQWLAFPPDGTPEPLVLADVVAAYRAGAEPEDPLPIHVQATEQVVRAAGELEDELFPDATTRLEVTLASAEQNVSPLDPWSAAGERVRRTAEALEKLAADLAELVEEQLDGGSLARLPQGSTRALAQSTQAAWRLRRLIDPPSPLYL